MCIIKQLRKTFRDHHTKTATYMNDVTNIVFENFTRTMHLSISNEQFNSSTRKVVIPTKRQHKLIVDH